MLSPINPLITKASPSSSSAWRRSRSVVDVRPGAAKGGTVFDRFPDWPLCAPCRDFFGLPSTLSPNGARGTPLASRPWGATSDSSATGNSSDVVDGAGDERGELLAPLGSDQVFLDEPVPGPVRLAVLLEHDQGLIDGHGVRADFHEEHPGLIPVVPGSGFAVVVKLAVAGPPIGQPHSNEPGGFPAAGELR